VTAPHDGRIAPPGDGEWRISHALAAFGTGVLASVAAYLLVHPGGVTVFESFAVVGGAQSLATIGVIAWLGRRPGRSPLRPGPAWSDPVYLLLGAALALAVSWLTYLVVVVVFRGEIPAQAVVQIVDEAEGWPAILAVVVVAVLLAPLAEELVFRGVLLRALGRRFSAGPAALVSAAAFALAHLALDFQSAVAVPALFVVGLVLALVVQRRGRLAPAVAAHMGFNLVGVLGLLLG
jgi:membrane protease YdiL (CAAX protease family)